MIKKQAFILFLLIVANSLLWGQNKNIYVIKSGTIKFFSEAKEELIRASSEQLKGAFDLKKRSFLFKISIASFIGFNNPVQREHFNENYMESDKYPEAVYVGKIIEDIDVTKNGEYNVRAKGKLKIHGVEIERIIKAHIICKNGTINIQSEFIVPLADHNIKIPRIVYDKLAPEINVSVSAVLGPN